MAKNNIEYPTVETYYILKEDNAQQIPDSYGSVMPNQCMHSGIKNIKVYTSFSEWKKELKKDGIIVKLNN